MGLLVLACHKQEEIPLNKSTETNKSVLMEQFSTCLAKALQEETFRAFIKKEASKQFDADYDILFNLSKHTTIDDEKTTLLSKLESYNTGELSIDEISELIPTINISIPDLTLARTYDWNTNTEIPLVALYIKGNKQCKTFNQNGEQPAISAEYEPINTTIVVRENERITAVQNNLKSTITNKKLILQENNINYYIDNISNGGNLKQYSQKLKQTNNRLKSNTTKSQRELAYYSSGEMNYSMKETLSAIRFTSPTALKRVSDNWAEGDLTINVILITGAPLPSGFQPHDNNKTFSKAELAFTASRNADQFVSCFKIPHSGPFRDNMIRLYKRAYNNIKKQLDENNYPLKSNDGKYFLNMNWEAFSWSPHRFGDQIQAIFKELDPTVDYKEEVTHSAGFDASIGAKDKWNIGTNGSVTSKVTISYQKGSDHIGNCIISYYEDYGLDNYRSIGDIEFVLEPKQ